MRVLLLNTAGGEGSVALADTEASPAVIASEVLPGRSASERLVPVVRRLMEEAGWKLGELAAIAVVHGPGSFTGVRVGLAAAKGLSEAGGAPLIAISRLELLAEIGDGSCAVLDAGRGEFYVGQSGAGEQLVQARDLPAICEGQSIVVCEARVAEALPQATFVAEPLAQDALPLALERIAAKQFDDAASVDANYLRRTDLEIFAKIRG